jgi:hypothetical protein
VEQLTECADGHGGKSAIRRRQWQPSARCS